MLMKESRNTERKAGIYISQTVSLVNSMLSTLWPATGTSTYHKDPSATTSKEVHPREQSSPCSLYGARGGIVLRCIEMAGCKLICVICALTQMKSVTLRQRVSSTADNTMKPMLSSERVDTRCTTCRNQMVSLLLSHSCLFL